MRTAHSLTVSCSICQGVYLGGGGVPAWGGVYLPKGGVPTRWGVPARGVYLPGGVPAQVLSLCTEFLAHATENITLPHLRCGGKNVDVTSVNKA